MKNFNSFPLLITLVALFFGSYHNAIAKVAKVSDPIENENADTGNKVIKYVCPMHPQIIRDHESTCPICGMDLVQQAFEQQTRIIVKPSGDKSQSDSESGFQGSQGTQFNFAIRTAPVMKSTLWKYVPTFGIVKPNESLIQHVHPYASGWIRSLSVKENGQKIKKGQLLYTFYSPDIVAAQQDYLLAIKSAAQFPKTGKSLIASSKIRLDLLGVNAATIKKIKQKKSVIHEIPVYAPQSGTVTNLTVKQGMYIEPKTEVMQLQDLTSVWVEAQILPLQQDWVTVGKVAEIRSDAYQGTYWEGDVSYIYPTVDPATKALRVRIPLRNLEGELKPEMIVSVGIYGGPQKDALSIPLQSVIDTGEEQRVVKFIEGLGFESVPVVLGMQSKGVVEVLNGLAEGDRVVSSGQFLLDSESQILTNLQKLMQSEMAKEPETNDSTFELMAPEESHPNHYEHGHQHTNQ